MRQLSGSSARQFCSFVVDGHLFGVPIGEVQEVLRAQPMTTVPRAPSVVRGLIHLRGQIVTALDVRTRLGLPARPVESSINLLVRDIEGAVSLLVDEIGDVLNVRSDAFEPVPDVVPRQLRNVVAGVYKLDKKLLLVVDIPRLVSIESEEAQARE